MKASRVIPAIVLLGAAWAVVHCADPVPDDLTKAQGPELEDYPIGEFHRPGQVCSACHRENGKAKTVFTVAGTIFAAPDKLIGVDSAEIQLTDSVGTTYIAVTNCVGNFYVTPDQWQPKFPILVRVHKGQTALQMKGPIGREASCNKCHLAHELSPEEQREAMPHLALFGGDEPDPTPASDAGCPVDAAIPGYLP